MSSLTYQKVGNKNRRVQEIDTLLQIEERCVCSTSHIKTFIGIL